jgi:transcriptional regulator with XRE-family HTH domain
MKPKTIYSKEYRELASLIKRARKGASLTQMQVAKKLGRPQSYVSKVEAGQYYIDVFELRDFSKLYKKRLEYFIKLSE